MKVSTFRGHAIHETDAGWVFSDSNGAVTDKCDCGYCGIANTTEGHDGCFGRLPFVMNACCGHGESRMAYLQFTPRLRLGGFLARWLGLAMRRFNRNPAMIAFPKPIVIDLACCSCPCGCCDLEPTSLEITIGDLFQDSKCDSNYAQARSDSLHWGI